ncbi:MAG: EamA family transporter [Gammaproteobacteria bacterium]|nr:EamA family transporter [Gammaproteobacteria bacterium]NND55383.1 EamA family transporter [Gammaproteobacteria bacterium]
MANLILYLATVLIWGSTWYAIDFQLGVVEPSVSLAYRYLIAAGIAFAWCVATRRSLRFPLRSHVRFLLLGTFLFGLNYLSAYQAQFYISSALNAIGFSTMIVINMLNAWLFFRRRPTGRMYLGAALGIAGILLVFLPEVEEVALTDAILIGMFFSVLGTLFASFGNIASEAMQRDRLPIMQANAWGMLYGALLNILIAVAQGKPFVIDTSLTYLGSLVYLAVIGSVVAFACYLTLLGRIGLERAGYASVLIPVVALLFSVMLEGLQPGVTLLAGLTLAVAGNVFVLKR